MAKQHSRRKGSATGGDVWKRCLQLAKGGEKDVEEYKILCEKLMTETPEVAIAKGAGHLLWNILVKWESSKQVKDYYVNLLPKLHNSRLRSDTYTYIGKLETCPRRSHDSFMLAHSEVPLSGYPLFQLGELCSRQGTELYNVSEALFWFAWGASCGKLSCPHCKMCFYTTLKEASCDSDSAADVFVRVQKGIGGKGFNDLLKVFTAEINNHPVSGKDFVHMIVISLYSLRQSDTYQKNKQCSQLLSTLLLVMCDQLSNCIEALVIGLLYLSQHKQQKESLRRFSAKSLNSTAYKVLAYLVSESDGSPGDKTLTCSPEASTYPGLLRPSKHDGSLRTVAESRFNDLRFYHNQFYKIKKKEEEASIEKGGEVSVSTISEGETHSKTNIHTTTDGDIDDHESDCSSDSLDEVILAHPGQLLGTLNNVFSQDIRCYPRPPPVTQESFDDECLLPPPREAPSPTFEASPLRDELYGMLSIPHYTLPESLSCAH